MIVDLGSPCADDPSADREITLMVMKPRTENGNMKLLSDLPFEEFKDGQLNIVMGKLNR
jgi:hypothetical protein